ncbi:hypothetical protein HGH92_26680 [Chitinophaga varians]|uniref:Uncharacterized protein n=1 Tax=Chitinophaga varians TaxID=2202339 RepID=A0A847RLN5_9BACT|nr:hypothetical protein [Chitinophaga varians]NLR67919.1 hypothetical protein [Chitinophaga varians]
MASTGNFGDSDDLGRQINSVVSSLVIMGYPEDKIIKVRDDLFQGLESASFTHSVSSEDKNKSLSAKIEVKWTQDEQSNFFLGISPIHSTLVDKSKGQKTEALISSYFRPTMEELLSLLEGRSVDKRNLTRKIEVDAVKPGMRTVSIVDNNGEVNQKFVRLKFDSWIRLNPNENLLNSDKNVEFLGAMSLTAIADRFDIPLFNNNDNNRRNAITFLRKGIIIETQHPQKGKIFIEADPPRGLKFFNEKIRLDHKQFLKTPARVALSNLISIGGIEGGATPSNNVAEKKAQGKSVSNTTETKVAKSTSRTTKKKPAGKSARKQVDEGKNKKKVRR